MRINKKLFPYPVINNDISRSTYKYSTFSLECGEIEQKDRECIIKNVHYKLENNQINSLIIQGIVKVYCVVECSSSIYRKHFEITTQPRDITISIDDLKDNVVVSSFAVLMDELANFVDEDFIDDYADYTYKLDKYDIIAADDGFSFKVDYEEELDNKLSSIFRVIIDSTLDLHTKVKLDSRKIYIYVPEDQFKFYDNLKNIEIVKPLFFSMLIIPALITVLGHLKDKINESSDLESLEFEYNWIKSIKKRYEKVYSRGLDEDELKNIDILEVSQALVDYPITKGIDNIYEMLFKEEGDDFND